MGKQKCIACKRKFESDRETLLCNECYEKYKQHMQLPKQAGVCPVCGGRGYVKTTCPECGGYGRKEYICSECGGSGHDYYGNECRNCVNGRETRYCERCGGDGEIEVVCSNCRW